MSADRGAVQSNPANSSIWSRHIESVQSYILGSGNSDDCYAMISTASRRGLSELDTLIFDRSIAYFVTADVDPGSAISFPGNLGAGVIDIL